MVVWTALQRYSQWLPKRFGSLEESESSSSPKCWESSGNSGNKSFNGHHSHSRVCSWREGVNVINILRAHFSYKFFTKAKTQLEKLPKWRSYKKFICKNVDEIDTRCQCHQYFTRAFLYKNLYDSFSLVTSN